MSKTILICGFGPGISHAVAEKFGAEGYAVALVARSRERTAAAVQAFEAQGVRAAAFQADATDPSAMAGLVQSVRGKLGPISVLHWNAYATVAGDLLAAPLAEVRAAMDVGVTSLVALVQAALPDLRAAKGGVLATNGGLALLDPQLDAVGVNYNLMGLSVANSAKQKLLRLLSEKLKPEGVYVGEVMVRGTIKGSAFDQGNATLDGSTVASLFWKLFTERSQLSVLAD